MSRRPVRRGHPLLRGALSGRLRVNGLRPVEQPGQPSDGPMDTQLSQLAQLRKQSLLSEDEYEAARTRLQET